MRTGKRTIKKSDLAQKNCLYCGRPFTWRKKWKKDWEAIKYCSTVNQTKLVQKDARQMKKMACTAL